MRIWQVWMTLLALSVAGFLGVLEQASHRTPVGQVIDNPQLATTDGGKARIMGDAQANVMVFFRPGEDNSRGVLKDLAAGVKEFAGKSVRFVGIVSDRHKGAEVQAELKEAGLVMPVLVDSGDKLFADLGLTLMPTICMADKAHKLAFATPFTKVNYWQITRAQIRYLLKEITEAQMQAALNPEAPVFKGEDSIARRHVKMAEMQLKSGQADKALDAARSAVQHGPKLAAAHSVMGAVLAAKGDCKAAVAAFDVALALDKNDARATAGKKACAEKR